MTWLLAGMGCTDVALSTVEYAPEADITSHASGATVDEGYAITLRGYVRDKDDDAEALVAAWYVDGVELCASSAPGSDGGTSCELVPDAGSMVVSLEVVDSDDQVAVATVDLVGLATEAPTALIIEPADGDTVLEEELLAFTGYVHDEEDGASGLDVWWESSLDGVLSVDASPDDNGEVTGSGYLTAGEHQLELHVVDLTGKSDVDSVQITVLGCTPLYPDGDGDGYGDASAEGDCELAGGLEDASDCDDDDAAVHPDADEACNQLDDDCDELVDEGLAVGSLPAPVAYWPLDDDGWTDGEHDVQDAVGESHGTSVGLTYEKGPTGEGAFLDGDGSGIGLGLPSALELDSTESFSILAWVRIDEQTEDYAVVFGDTYNSTANSSVYMMAGQERDAGWVPSLYMRGSSGPAGALGCSSDASIVGTGWRHLAASYDADAGTARLFVDGVLVTEEDFTQVSGSVVDDTLHIGRYGSNAGGNTSAVFSLDDVAVLGGALSEDDIECALTAYASSGQALAEWQPDDFGD